MRDKTKWAGQQAYSQQSLSKKGRDNPRRQNSVTEHQTTKNTNAEPILKTDEATKICTPLFLLEQSIFPDQKRMPGSQLPSGEKVIDNRETKIVSQIKTINMMPTQTSISHTAWHNTLLGCFFVGKVVTIRTVVGKFVSL